MIDNKNFLDHSSVSISYSPTEQKHGGFNEIVSPILSTPTPMTRTFHNFKTKIYDKTKFFILNISPILSA